MKVKVYRNVDTLRLRKWVVELWDGNDMLDRRRLFGGLFFAKRLARKVKRMKVMYAKAATAIRAA